MRHNLTRTAFLAVALSLTSCSLVDQLRYSVAEYTGRLAAVECRLSDTERRSNLAAVNGWLASNGREARVHALDCNGDGKPDL